MSKDAEIEKLCTAIKEDNLDVIEELLKTNERIFYQYISQYNDQPLGYMAYKRKFDMFELVYKHFNGKNTSWYIEVMYKAAIKNKVDVLEFCLNHGADIEVKEGNGRTALFGAIIGGHQECFNFLIERGANVNALSKHHQTPLIVASKYGCYEMAKKLLELGADPTVITSYRSTTALQVADTPEMKSLIQSYIPKSTSANIK